MNIAPISPFFALLLQGMPRVPFLYFMAPTPEIHKIEALGFFNQRPRYRGLRHSAPLHICGSGTPRG
jgi:hypothetical protein